MMQPGRCASLALLFVVLVSASAASARTERFRWTSSASGVDNFKLYMGPSSGSYPAALSVGIPPKDSTGAYYYDVSVNDADTIYVAVTAIDGTLESPKSNQIVRAGITSGGGTTPPPPTTASAAVVGFALWNASNDSVVDSNFASGDSISSAISSCAAIEIKGNAYLNANGAGSIKKVFDGQDRGCTGTGGENSAPFAWEDDAGTGAFPCAASLAASGSHTLKVTPYDGDNCSGLAGSPVTLTFTVAAPTAPPPSTLGAPGQPYIVQ